MHITQESDYAVRIVYCLAKCGTRRDARGISEEMCVTLRFSLKILGKLVSSGIVESYKGNRGGYELARPASEITLKDVIDAVEGPYRLSRCVGEGGAGECNRGASGCCTFQRYFTISAKASTSSSLPSTSRCCWRNRPASKKRKSHTAPCVPSVVFSFPLFSGFPLTACKNRIIMLKCIIMAWYVSERKTVTIFLCKLLKIGGVPKPFCVIFCKA